ncbi:hypothetical protein B0H17DRAFT_1094828, partial [Mycena rosella]
FVQRPFVARYPPFPSPNIFILALSAVPSTIVLYTILTLVCTSFVIYAAHHELPSIRLLRLNNLITAVKDILAHAKSECLRDHLVIAYEEEYLIRVINSPFMLRVKLSMSDIQTGLLEVRDTPWKIFIHKMWTIWHNLSKCERKVRGIQTSLLLILEAEHRRKLAEDLSESREAVNSVIHSQSEHIRLARNSEHQRRGHWQGTSDGEGRQFDFFFPEHITQRVKN